MNLLNRFSRIIIISFLMITYGFSNEPGNFALSSDGVKISFEKNGDGEPAIIFVHGWANDKTIWNAQMKYFSKKYTSVAIDVAGFGKSGNNRKDWTIEAFSEDVDAVINKLKLNKVVLVGFSMGGPVVIESANKIPNKVLGLVLVDNLQNVEMKFPPQTMGKMDSIMMDLVKHPTKEKLIKGGFIKKNPDMAYKRGLEMIDDSPMIGWKESIHAVIHWQNEQCTNSLSKIKVPIIAINSDQKPTNVDAFRKYVPGYKVKLIHNSGHVVMWDATDEFNKLLEESIHEFKAE